QSVSGAIDSIPGMREALQNGTQMTLRGSDLPSEAISNINLSGNILKDAVTERITRDTHLRGDQKFRMNKDIKRHNTNLPEDLSNVTVEVNADVSNIPVVNTFNNILLGNIVIRNNGKIIGGFPIVDTKNPVVKQFGEALVELYENPNATPQQVFSGMMGAFSGINSGSVNKDVYDDMKQPLPEDSFYDQEIDLGAKPGSKYNAIMLLSDALECACFCDDFDTLLDKSPFNDIPQRGTVREIINKINETYGLTCYVNNGQLCFYSIKWFEEIQKLMPSYYVNKWLEQYKNELYLSAENLKEMGMFTPQQLEYGMRKCYDMKEISKNVIRQHATVEFISGLSENAYANIFSENGMRISKLNDKDYENLSKIREIKKYLDDESRFVKIYIYRVKINDNTENVPDREIVQLLVSDNGTWKVVSVIVLPKYTQVQKELKIPSNVPKDDSKGNEENIDKDNINNSENDEILENPDNIVI
ncbi:MAG: hypothetical protein KBT47_02085, partial [Armatimonadetes bacterium]|nr:hypothetical protein [Candidatus Hippobium faecium]